MRHRWPCSLFALATGCGPGGGASDLGPADDLARSDEHDVPILDPLVPFPPTLDEAGIYLDDDPSRPNPLAFEYRPRAELWSNGLGKRRLLLLPVAEHIDARREPWQFPPGTLFVKTFSDLVGPLETRILRQTGERFEYATYRWQEDGDAVLLDGRSNVPLTVQTAAGTGPHTIPSTLTCRQCHESSNAQVLGFGALQLWAAELPPNIDDAFRKPPALEDPVSATDETERAVLDYFIGNCVHCHNDSIGLASSFDLRPDVAFDNVIGRPTDSSSTAAGTRVVKGSPAESILFRAVSGEGDTRDVKEMPPEGVQLRDPAAVELLREWILELD